MAPLTFTTKSLEPVPNDTIRKTWDPYTSINFGGTNIGKPKTSKLPVISKLGGTYKHMKNIFVMYPNFHQMKTYRSGRVPIGGWAEVSNNAGRRLSLLQKFNPPCGTNFVDKMVYGEGEYTGPQFPERLTDDVATNCAGGSGLTFNEYPTTKEDNFINKKDAFTTKQCFYGNRTPQQNKDQCLKGGVQYPVFCQLGDYVATNPKCAQQCSGVKSDTDNPNYCNYAYDRLCGKLIGDPLKKDKLNTLVRSTKDYIKEPVCVNYCGSASDKSSELCQQHKLAYCTTGGSFDNNKSAYCSEFCTTNEDLCFGNKSVMDKLCPPSAPTEPPSALCDKYTQKECSNTTALPTERCFKFCKSNPELCMDSLKEFCEGKQNRLDEPVSGFEQKKYSDYCGCIQDISEYDKYKTSVIESLTSRKLRIALGNELQSNYCISPNCNEDSIKPPHLQPCKNNCLEQVFKGYNFTEFNNDHILECDEFGEIVDEPVSSEPPPITEPIIINEEIPVFSEEIHTEPEIPDELLLPEIPTGPDTPVSDEPEPLVSETPGLESSSLEEPPASTLAAPPPVTSAATPPVTSEPVPDAVGTPPESEPAPFTSAPPPVTKPPDFTFTDEEEITEDTITTPSTSEEVIITSGTGTRTESEIIEGGPEKFSLNIGEQAGIGIAIGLIIFISLLIYFLVKFVN